MEDKLIRKANYLIEATYRLSAVEQKIIAVLATSIKAEDEDFKPCPIKIKDFLAVTSDSLKNYDWLEKIIINLKGKNLRLVYQEEDGAEITINTGWILSTKHKTGSGIVELCFDPKLKPFFLNLKNRFTKYRLKNIITLKSQFSIRIYELLKQYEKIGQRLFDYDELRAVLGVTADQYRQYTDFRKKVILVAQAELEKKTDILFTFEELRKGRGIGKIRFLISTNEEKSNQITELTQLVIPHHVNELPENKDLEKLISLLPSEYREKESVEKLLQIWLAKENVDYVARNIEYTNDSSNAVKPGINPRKGINYRNYLSKALINDYGLPHKEDQESAKKIEEAARRKAHEATAAKKEAVEKARIERKDQDLAKAYLASLTPEDRASIQAEAISGLNEQQRELVNQKAIGSKMIVKLAMDAVALQRLKNTPGTA
ncbi:MAG: replication initiation protein [Terrimicrobiaceae bacterium]